MIIVQLSLVEFAECNRSKKLQILFAKVAKLIISFKVNYSVNFGFLNIIFYKLNKIL